MDGHRGPSLLEEVVGEEGRVEEEELGHRSGGALKGVRWETGWDEESTIGRGQVLVWGVGCALERGLVQALG